LQNSWCKEANISTEDKKSLISDLRIASDKIEEAMNFTIKRERRNPVVKFSIGPNHVSFAYSLRVFYTGKDGWSMSINRKNFDKDRNVVSDDVLAEIICRK
jgi:hypothetical protein